MIQVYTGEGKGKTTAALGLALRALGAGFRVLIIQFMKKGDYSEIKALKKFNNLEIKQFGSHKFIDKSKIKKEDFERAEKGLAYAIKKIKNKKYNLVILDEINVALDFGLIKKDRLIKFLKNNSLSTEIVLTGRNAHDKIIKLADLVTIMNKNKHYFDQGLKARKGIEY
ncbi:MAG: cob(I)yrinic acid a,c-diamide adenosyltransferase [Patescibacteria group bacterium]|nr:cob(I)yrinic acid a,c-diamide adenosyltransferase [Patescibacteria group bacterium]